MTCASAGLSSWMVQETHPKNALPLWLQTNRVAQRLIGNFGFSNGQRSFDGLDSHYAGRKLEPDRDGGARRPRCLQHER